MLSRSLGLLYFVYLNLYSLANGVLLPLPQWLIAAPSTLHVDYELDCFIFHTSGVLCSLCF